MSESHRVAGAEEVELMGNVLDLGRPELAPIMSRYMPKAPSPQNPVFRPPTALVVARSEGDERPVVKALEKDGWCIKICAGPGRTVCPLMSGERCTLRESVDAAVVFMDPGELDRYIGTLPRIRCAADPSSPAVVALEGRLEPAKFEGSTAIIGAVRGPEGVLSAISALLASHAD